MNFDTKRQTEFFSEMSERQISAREFFSGVLLESLSSCYGLENGLIMCFDTDNGFLSWTDSDGVRPNSRTHPYRAFQQRDTVRGRIYREAVAQNLDYFNVEPRLYRATDYIDESQYLQSDHVRFLEENFGAGYSVTMAFGINAYIQIVFFRSADEGDFTDEEMKILADIYVAIANAYKGFKKYEQSKIVSAIQDEIIKSGARAYFITDDFMHILGGNSLAAEYIENILGPGAGRAIDSDGPCIWLPFLLEGTEKGGAVAKAKIIKGYVFRIYNYDQQYSHGIVDRYHWITMSPGEGREDETARKADVYGLTRSEQKVAKLLLKGLTYKAIAEELFISYHTVKKHVENIYAKCGVKSRHQLSRLFDEEI